ncbi:hypothetical protein D9M71_285530 [compost metagenome]
MSLRTQFIDQLRQGREGRRRLGVQGFQWPVGLLAQQHAQGLHAHQVERLERQAILRQRGEISGKLLQRALFPLENRGGQWIALGGLLGKQAVDDQVLTGQANAMQLVMGVRGLLERGRLRSRDQHQAGLSGVGQSLDRIGILALLLFQPDQRPQVGGGIGIVFQIAGPGAGQFQHADGMSGGRSIEDDMLEVAAQRLIRQ